MSEQSIEVLVRNLSFVDYIKVTAEISKLEYEIDSLKKIQQKDFYKLACDNAIKYINKLDEDYIDYDGEIVIGDISDIAKRDLLNILDVKI